MADTDGIPNRNGNGNPNVNENGAATANVARETRAEHIVITGGGGAGVVCEDPDVRFLEVRITVVGRVVGFGVPRFEMPQGAY